MRYKTEGRLRDVAASVLIPRDFKKFPTNATGQTVISHLTEVAAILQSG